MFNAQPPAIDAGFLAACRAGIAAPPPEAAKVRTPLLGQAFVGVKGGLRGLGLLRHNVCLCLPAQLVPIAPQGKANEVKVVEPEVRLAAARAARPPAYGHGLHRTARFSC